MRGDDARAASHACLPNRSETPGNILVREYAVDGLPPDAQLTADLHRSLELYRDLMEALERP